MIALSAGTDDIVAKSDVTPKKVLGVTEEKQIDDLIKQMEKCKSPICFSSGGTEIMTI